MVKEFIAMYLPALIAAVEGFSVFWVLLKKIKKISFKKDTEELNVNLIKVVEENKKLRQENRAIRKQLSLLIDKKYKIKDYEDKIENEEE